MNEASEGVVSGSRDDGRTQSVSGGSDRDICGASTQEFAERRHVFEPHTGLKGVNVDPDTTDGDDIVRGAHGRTLVR